MFKLIIIVITIFIVIMDPEEVLAQEAFERFKVRLHHYSQHWTQQRQQQRMSLQVRSQPTVHSLIFQFHSSHSKYFYRFSMGIYRFLSASFCFLFAL